MVKFFAFHQNPSESIRFHQNPSESISILHHQRVTKSCNTRTHTNEQTDTIISSSQDHTSCPFLRYCIIRNHLHYITMGLRDGFLQMDFAFGPCPKAVA